MQDVGLTFRTGNGVASAGVDAKLGEVAKKPDAKSDSKPDVKSAAKGEDVVLIHGRSEDGALQILRKKGEELSAGELRPMEEGKPVQGDILKLKPRREMPLVCDVEEEVKIPKVTGAKKPARVSSDQYRDGWEKLWGRRAQRRRSKAN